MLSYRLAVVLLLVPLSPLPGGPRPRVSAQDLAAVGDEICIEGYVMDTYCIELGRLLDNPQVVTLEGPDKHSVHCLVDVPLCVDSGYEILVDPINGTSTAHCRSYKLDVNGTFLVQEAARDWGKGWAAGGSCSTCRNGDSNAPEYGYRAAVVGTVTSLGDSDGTPAGLDVVKVRQSSAGCPPGTVLKLPPASTRCRLPQAGTAMPLPTTFPTTAPSAGPSYLPSKSPIPSVAPSTDPSSQPTISSVPSVLPSAAPSAQPTVSTMPSESPSVEPSSPPTQSLIPSTSPSAVPSFSPTRLPLPTTAPMGEP